MSKGIRIKKSKVVHLYWEAADRTDCGAGGMGDAIANGGVPTDDAVTCKRCLKALAVEIEQAHAEALKMNEVYDSAMQNVTDALDRLHAEALEINALVDGVAETDRARMAEKIGRAHAEAIEENMERHGCHLVKWFDAEGVRHYCDVRVPLEGIPWRDQQHEGPCYDALTETWREEVKPTAKQRRAARRALRASVRKATPQTRAAARARRAKRGAARATAKTLLVASGVPQDVAERYAPAFSRGVQAPTVAVRMPLHGHRSKRVDVKRYTWSQFEGRLRSYRPANHLAHLQFEHAAAKVGLLP